MLPRFNSNFNGDTTMSVSEIGWQHLGAELIFTQDTKGNYLSFWWSKAQQYGLDNHHQIWNQQQPSQKKTGNLFTPVDSSAYLEKISRVVKRRLPEQCYCLFQCGTTSYAFELIISPILPARGEAKTVMVIGHFQ